MARYDLKRNPDGTWKVSGRIRPTGTGGELWFTSLSVPLESLPDVALGVAGKVLEARRNRGRQDMASEPERGE